MNTDAPESARRVASSHAAQRLAALVLAEQTRRITPHQLQRLQQARAAALAHARWRTTPVRRPALAAVGVPVREPDRPGWFTWGAALAAALLLAFGLVTLQHFQNERLIRTTADIDTALLLDDLPPAAYADPGFARYLKQQS